MRKAIIANFVRYFWLTQFASRVTSYLHWWCSPADPIKILHLMLKLQTISVKVSHVKIIHFEDVTLAKDDTLSLAHQDVPNVAKLLWQEGIKHMIRCMPVNLFQMWWLRWTPLSWKAFKRSHMNACWWISSNCDNCDEPLCPEKHLKFMQFISLWSYLCICFSIVVHLSSMMVRFLLLEMHKCGVSLILNLSENSCNFDQF